MQRIFIFIQIVMHVIYNLDVQKLKGTADAQILCTGICSNLVGPLGLKPLLKLLQSANLVDIL